MGCCGSTTAKTTKTHQPHINLTAPSAPPDEESVVKEVLSETPISKPPHRIFLYPQQPPPSQLPPNSISTTLSNNAITTSHQLSNPLLLTGLNTHFDQLSNPPPLAPTPQPDTTSQLSQITPQVSQSSTTTTVTEIRDDEVTSNKRVLNTSPGKLQKHRPYTGDRLRRERPLNGGVRREVTRAAKRDTAEASARRSRSPATRLPGALGKGRGGEGPGKVTGAVGNRMVEKEGQKEEGNGGASGEEQGSESLENPLVSLECFIFL